MADCSSTSDKRESSSFDSEDFESEEFNKRDAVASRREHDESGYLSRQKLTSESESYGSDLSESFQSQEQLDLSSKLKDHIPEALNEIKPVHEANISAAWRANMIKMEKEKEERDQESSKKKASSDQPQTQAHWEALSFEYDNLYAIDKDCVKTSVYKSGSDTPQVQLIRRKVMIPLDQFPLYRSYVKTDQNLRVRSSASGREGQLREDMKDLDSDAIRQLAPARLDCNIAEAEKRVQHDAMFKQLESPDVFVALVNELLKFETPKLEGKPTFEEIRKSEVFRAISNFYGGAQAVFPYVLEQKYLRLEKIAPMERPLPQVPRAEDRAGVMKPMQKKFCRRCFTYGCLIHSTDMDNLKMREVIMQEPVTADRSAKRVPCSRDCYKVAKLGGKTTAPAATATRQEDENWTEDEKALFLSAGRVYKNDPCRLAEIILTKNCIQTSTRLQRMTQENAGFLSTGTPSVAPGKVRKTMTFSSFSTYCKKHALLLGVRPEHRSAEELPCYYPCDHEGPCQSEIKCQCYDNGIPCEKYCRCFSNKDTCKNMFPGCRCTGSCGLKCECAVALRECDMDICGCKDMKKFRKEQVLEGTGHTTKDVEESKPNPGKYKGCKNSALQFKMSSKTTKFKSPVAGWGLIATEVIPQDHLVGEYCGELVSVSESEKRGLMYDSKGTTYLFNRDADTTIDGMHFASLTRFINSAPEDQANCYALCKNVGGTLRIGLYAQKEIQKHEELFFDYQRVLETQNQAERRTHSSKFQINPGKIQGSRKREVPNMKTKKTMDTAPAEDEEAEEVPLSKNQAQALPASPLGLLMEKFNVDGDDTDTNTFSD